MVSISTRFITWDLSTSDLQRDVNPGIDGIMQQLILSPDNKWAAAYSNNNQTVLLNMLSSEFVIVENPFGEDENVTGVFLLNQKYGKQFYLIYTKIFELLLLVYSFTLNGSGPDSICGAILLICFMQKTSTMIGRYWVFIP